MRLVPPSFDGVSDARKEIAEGLKARRFSSQVGNPSFKAICAKLGLTTVSDSIRCAESKYCVTQAIHNG